MDAVETVDVTQEQEIAEAAEAAAEPVIKPATETAEVEPETDDYDYKKDKRWGKIWKSDKDIYKSFKEFEKTYPKKMKDLEAKIKGYTDNEPKYKEYQNVYEYVQGLANDPNLQPKLKEFLETIELERKKAQFGNLPPEVLDRLDKQSQELLKLQEWRRTEEEKRDTDKDVQEIEKNIGQIDDFAKAKGIEYDKEQFIKWCRINKIPISTMYHVFRSRALDVIEKNSILKAQEDVTGSIKKNRKGAILSAGAKVGGAKTEKGWDEANDEMADGLMESLGYKIG